MALSLTAGVYRIQCNDKSRHVLVDGPVSRGAELAAGCVPENSDSHFFALTPSPEDPSRFTLVPVSNRAVLVDYTMADAPPILWDLEAEGNLSQLFEFHGVSGGEWVTIRSSGNQGKLLVCVGSDSNAPLGLADVSDDIPEVARFYLHRREQEPHPAADAAPSQVAQPATESKTQPTSADPPEHKCQPVSQPAAAAPAAEPKKEEARSDPPPAPTPSPPPAKEVKSKDSSMNRDEFMRRLGLSSDDVVDPSVRTDAMPGKYDPDDDGVTEDIIKTADLADPSLFQQPTAKSEYRAQELDKFRTVTSKSSPQKTTPGGAPSAHDAPGDSVLQEHDSKTASNYKSKLLEDFRARKSTGVSKSLPNTSPQRRQPQGSAASSVSP